MSSIKPIKIVIFGTGGFGKEVLWTLMDCNLKNKKYEILGFIDENKSSYGKKIHYIPILGGVEWFKTKNAKDVKCVVAIGDSLIRKKVVKKLEKLDIKFTSVIHPSVISSKFNEIGEGTIIQAGCILPPDIKIGKHVLINIDCTLGHDCILHDFVTLSPGVRVNGEIVIEEGAYLGTGTITRETIRIRKWSITGAGTVLINDVPPHVLYAGVPGKLKKSIKTKKNRPHL